MMAKKKSIFYFWYQHKNGKKRDAFNFEMIKYIWLVEWIENNENQMVIDVLTDMEKNEFFFGGKKAKNEVDEFFFYF